MENERFLSQQDLMQLLQTTFAASGRCCEKTQSVLARPAIDGERIVTVTSSGVETENVAVSGHYVVKNLTSAGEQYIISKETFEDRYQLIGRKDGAWSEYLPVGRIMTIVVSAPVLKTLNMPPSFEIMASWGRLQKVREGDILAIPLPDKGEVYRIDRKEFDQTYRYVD